MPHANIIHVTNLQLPELELYSRFSENQLLHYFEPESGVFIAESPIVAGGLWMPVMSRSLFWQKKVNYMALPQN